MEVGTRREGTGPGNWKEGSAIQENKQFQKMKQSGAIGDEFHLSWEWGRQVEFKRVIGLDHGLGIQPLDQTQQGYIDWLLILQQG